ncbi:hypothetical protein ACFXAE_28185 [Streptomyces sp. NPDC059454]|uniref:hypothetical protein n=1 Tax=Streptomyces sp. NPDC059454 TaxID=3346836 RepID=UPI0036BD3795
MAEYEFDLDPKSPPEVIAARNALADEVCRELTRSGLPVYRADLENDREKRPGAAVHVDPLVDGGVFVNWRTETELRDSTLELFAKGIDYTNPPSVVLHHKTINDCMRVAVLAILTSAGFTAEEPDGHTRGSMLHVTGRRH